MAGSTNSPTSGRLAALRCLLVSFLLSAVPVLAQTDSITISEVMFDPSGSEATDEYVELYNFSTTQTYDLSAWLLSDNAGGNDSDKIVNAGEGTLLYPGQFAVVFDADYSVATGRYLGLVPDTSRILKISGTTFGNGGLSNSSVETILLIKPSMAGYDTVSRYSYTVDNLPGHSDEKISLTADNSITNWTNGLYDNGTPGAPPTTDLSVEAIAFEPVAPASEDSFQVMTTIYNRGIRPVTFLEYRLYLDANGNGLPDGIELVDSSSFNLFLSRNDCTIVNSIVEGLPGGNRTFIATVSSPLDSSTANNQLSSIIAILFSYDLSLNTARISPLHPSQGSPFMLNVVVENNGVRDLTGFTLRIYDDLNSDGFPSSSEQIDSTSISIALLPGDSVEHTVYLPGTTVGRHRLLVISDSGRLLPGSDESPNNDTVAVAFDVSPARNSIVINEINYQPSDSSTEWIELYNRSSDTINLRNWKVADGNSDQNGFAGPKTFCSTSYFMKPGDFVIVGKDSGLFVQKYGLTASRAFFTSNFPSLNNSGDIVGVLDSSLNTMDSLRFEPSWGGALNRSLERRFPDSSGLSPSNWATSLAVDGGSPGMANTVIPPNQDLVLQSVFTSPVFPSTGQVYKINVSVKNEGLMTSYPFQLELFRIIAQDTLYLTNQSFGPLLPTATVMAEFQDTAITSGQITMLHVSMPGDESPENNSFVKSIVFRSPSQAVIINEINYLPSSASTEWVELYNRSQHSIDLKKWLIADEASFTSPKVISNSSVSLPPNGFLVIARDSILFRNRFPGPIPTIFMTTLPSLNNSGDQLVLFDSTRSVVDSLYYDARWGGDLDVSLERIAPDSLSYLESNWQSTSSSQGGSPGTINTITPLPFDAAVFPSDITLTPEFPVSGDHVQVRVVLRNVGLEPLNSCLVRLFDDANNNQIPESSELIDSALVTSVFTGDSSILTFEWVVPTLLFRESRQRSVTRMIIVQIDYPSDQRPENGIAYLGVKIGSRPQTLIVNEILYQPDASSVEFVEIFNNSAFPIDLQNFRIADASTSKIITTGAHVVPAFSFRVLTGDTLFFSRFPFVPDSLVLLVSSMPSLGNSEDAIVIKDDVGHTIDSVYYFSSWGGGNGKSLERLRTDESSLDPGNWTTSVSPEKSTPALPNSASSATPFSRNSLVLNEVMYSPFPGEAEYVEIYNPGNSPINLLNWSIQVGNSKSVLTSTVRMLEPNDYLILSSKTSLPSRFQYNAQALIVPEDGLPALTNAGARVILRDWIGTVIDSVDYIQTWGGGDGISLERRKPQDAANQSQNWGSCVFPEGGTPGAINSIYTGLVSKRIRILADPNPFFVDQHQETVIQLELPVVQSRLTLRIYDSQGRLVRTLLNNSPSGNHREVHWDGKDESNRTARMGIYIIYLEAIEELGGYNGRAKATVVLGRRL